METGLLELLKAIGPMGIFGFLVIKMILDKQEAHRQAETRVNGEDHESGQRLYLAKLIESIETMTKAIGKLMEDEEEERRLLHRIEKHLDDFHKH